MKQIITGLCTLLCMSAAAQQQVTINGTAGNLNSPAKIYLNHRDTSGAVISDSAELQNGKFTIKTTVPEIIDAVLIMAHNGESLRNARSVDHIFVILEGGTINITTKDSLVNATVTGTPLNVDYAALAAKKRLVEQQISKLRGEYNAYISEGNTADYTRKMDALNAEYKTHDFDYIKSHPSSYMDLMILQVYVASEPITTFIEPAFKSIAPAIRETRLGKKIGEGITDFKRTDINALAPDFTQADTSGNNIALSSLRGKYVLVDFWASWCKPCRAENPNVVKAFDTYHNKNFTVVGISLDYPGAKPQWLKAIADDHLGNWTQLSDLQGGQNAAAKLYNVSSIPQNFLLDPSGKIIAKNLRGEALQQKLAALLN